jgi:hypothetical protein
MDASEHLDILARVATVADAAALAPAVTAVLVLGLDDAKAEALSRHPGLRTLYHDGQPALTDAGLRALAHLRSLQVLDLEWCDRITDAGLQALTALHELEWLDLSFCAGVTAAGVTALERALPQCMIER